MVVETETRQDRWTRAMARAETDHLRAELIHDGLYAVRSVSCRGTKHLVTLRNEKISTCDCAGWRGSDHPCKHAGAVARRLMRERGLVRRTRRVPPTPEIEEKEIQPMDMPGIESRSTRGMIYRPEEVA